MAIHKALRPRYDINRFYATRKGGGRRLASHKRLHGLSNTRTQRIYKNKVSVFATVSHQTGLDTRSMTRRPIKVGIKGMGWLGTSRDSNPAGLCWSLTHLVQCESNEPSSFTDPNLGPGTDAGI